MRIKYPLTPKSHKQLKVDLFPIEQGILRLFRSFSLGGICFTR